MWKWHKMIICEQHIRKVAVFGLCVWAICLITEQGTELVLWAWLRTSPLQEVDCMSLFWSHIIDINCSKKKKKCCIAAKPLDNYIHSKRELRHQTTVTSSCIRELDKEEATAFRYVKQKKKSRLSCSSTHQLLITLLSLRDILGTAQSSETLILKGLVV